MSHAFIDDRRRGALDPVQWALPLAMLLLPLGGMLLFLIPGILIGEGFVTPEVPPPGEPRTGALPPRRK